MILINVKFPVRPERLDEWTSLARGYAEAVEGFRDAAAGAAHVGTAHFAEMIAKGPDLVAAQPSIIYIDAPQVEGWGPMGEIQPR